MEGELKKYNEIPIGGVLPREMAGIPRTGGWRTEVKPIVELGKCVNCLLCWIDCPDVAVVIRGTEFVGFDYDYCKGCELCAAVCPTGAIQMVEEGREVPAWGRIQEASA
ncbi:MAG TPA: 4Fe-4S dicluster-binding protein [Spirochaetia bacterium]|nr:4Fe-4S dicluster-binding protein [Spirochaetia bacterium]